MNITELPELAKVFHFDEQQYASKMDEVKTLRGKANDLLPFEQAQIDKLLTKKVEEASNIKSSYNALDKKYKRIDLDIITKMRIWNRSLSCYVPRFAIYNMDVTTQMRMSLIEVFRHTVERTLDLEHMIRLDIETNYRYSQDIKEFKNYSDISIMSGYEISRYVMTSSDRHFAKISHIFEGFLPDNIRSIVKTAVASKDFSMSELYLIEESYNWKREDYKEVIPQRNLDPVIIGIRGGVSYYLCSFDVTPAEKFLVSELVA